MLTTLLTAEGLEALLLSPEDPTTVIATVRAARDAGLAAGLAIAGLVPGVGALAAGLARFAGGGRRAELPLAALGEAIDAVPPVPLAGLPALPGGALAAAWPLEAGVVEIDARGAVVAAHAGATLAAGEGRVRLDGRRAAAAVRLVDDDGDVVVVASGVDVLVVRVETPGPATLAEIAGEPGAGALPAPELLLGAASARRGAEDSSMWPVVDLGSLFRSRDPLLVACAVGVAGRLAPARAGAPTPGQQALRWFEGLDASTVEAAQRSAIVAIGGLARRLDALERRIAIDPRTAARATLHWLHRRDDLEGFVWLARATRRAPAACEEATRLDETSIAHLSAFVAVPGLGDDPRLAEVGTQEPETWWGHLAFSPAA